MASRNLQTGDRVRLSPPPFAREARDVPPGTVVSVVRHGDGRSRVTVRWDDGETSEHRSGYLTRID